MEGFIELMFSISDRVEELQERGFTGQEIAMRLRDDGYALKSVEVALGEAGFQVRAEPFLDLKGLFVSDFPLLPGQSMAIYHGVRNSSQITIWLHRSGPSNRNAHMD